jgi:hypothetical protein
VTSFRRPAFEAQMIANATLTHQESEGADQADDRAYLSLSYRGSGGGSGLSARAAASRPMRASAFSCGLRSAAWSADFLKHQ